jgi:hypothetical protein
MGKSIIDNSDKMSEIEAAYRALLLRAALHRARAEGQRP